MSLSIELVKGSILDVKADALVNPANSFLQHGGGLAQVIDSAAQHLGSDEATFVECALARLRLVDVYRDWCREGRMVPTGSAVIGPAGMLEDRGFKAIIHAVGPIWGGGEYFERQLLFLAYETALLYAEDAGFKSIVMPAISAGIFGVPIEVVAERAIMAASWTSLDKVTFALMEDAHVEAFAKAYENYTR